MKSLHSCRLLLSVIMLWMISMPVRAWVAERPVQGDALPFSFYGKTLTAASLKTVEVKSVSEFDVSKAWHEYKKRDVAPVLTSLRSLSDELGLNDWFVFELVRSYADELLGKASPMDRVVLEHYLLVGMGYDVRLARTERQLLLLVPFEQEVYERYFIKIDGQDYYLFFDDLEFNPNEKSVVYPCDPIRNSQKKGQTFDLLFREKVLNVSPEEDRMCDFDDGQIHITCKVNPLVMKMLRDYPLMDLQCYASSVVLPQFHVTIQEQLMPQLEGMSQCDAADALLHFVQYVFGYEDDVEQYGQEKVNFVEENFFYDNNDCEDRSILYAFLVNSLLGLDVQFIHYPGHECTGVRFTDCLIRGNGYYYGEDYYLICDPSYIGGTIGRCMPEYRTLQPVVKSMIPVSAFDSEASPLVPRLDKRLILSDITLDPVTL